MRMQHTEEIKGLLNDLDFPASKEEIAGHAGLAEHMRDRQAPPIADELGRAPGGRPS